MRMDIRNIANELAKGRGLGFDILETYRLIFEYCKATGTSPRRNTYEIRNGVLAINGKNIDRVQPLTRPEWTEEGYRIEGMILAREGH